MFQQHRFLVGRSMQRGKQAGKKIVRVLIMDAQDVVRQALSSMINRQPDMKVVAETESASQLLEKFKQSYPDVALLDLETSGSSEIRAILEQNPNARIIALSLYEDTQTVQLALQAGALMWMLKGSGKIEVLEALRTCMRSAPAPHEDVVREHH
jgi:DNA-binding NarL/FixJ family response regulator